MSQFNTQVSLQPTTLSIDSANHPLYTAEQVEAIAVQAIKLAFQQVSAGHLDNSIPQLSPAITVAEAARMIRISKPTMYELIRSNQIHSIRVGRKILVSRQSLLDWVEGRK